MIMVTSPFYWYHAVTLTLTFDLSQGQICCRAGDHNSSNLLVSLTRGHIQFSQFFKFGKCNLHYVKNDVITKAHIFEMALSKEQYTEILKLE